MLGQIIQIGRVTSHKLGQNAFTRPRICVINYNWFTTFEQFSISVS